jgi:hypothetical protein
MLVGFASIINSTLLAVCSLLENHFTLELSFCVDAFFLAIWECLIGFFIDLTLAAEADEKY